jgi:hypothetical protein
LIEAFGYSDWERLLKQKEKNMRREAPVLPRLNKYSHITPGREILCPHCGDEISLSEALLTQYAAQIETELKSREQVATARIEKEVRLKVAHTKDLEFQVLKNQLIEKDKSIARAMTAELELRKKIRTLEQELKKKPEATQYVQGETLELEMVSNARGELVGTIVWETKRKKVWTENWVDKIKSDQRGISAECAVIVSDNLPVGISGFGFYQGVWVCDNHSSIGLARVLRKHLIDASAAKPSDSRVASGGP